MSAKIGRPRSPDPTAPGVNFALRESHVAKLSALSARLAAAGVQVSRSRLVQYAVEQLAADDVVERMTANNQPSPEKQK